MSCPNSTAPIDISMSKITGKCDLKCSYTYHYNNSSCIATNRDDYISVAYDKSTTQVLYNAIPYFVQEIRIYTPSLHSFNGNKYDAEIIISHYSNTNANYLLVCIPIQSNNSATKSASFFQTLVDTVASSAPNDGDVTTVNTTFTLDDIVLKKPFFSYSATEPYQPCNANVDYIVYQDAIDMTPDTLTKLQTIIKSNPYDIKTGPNLFYNEKGPNQGASGSDNIYIDCQPVGSSEDTTEVVISGGDVDIMSIFNAPYVKIILGALLFILLLYIVKNGLHIFSTNTTNNVTNVVKRGIMTK